MYIFKYYCLNKDNLCDELHIDVLLIGDGLHAK